MQQDRLIGAAGEGRYAAFRGWAGPAGVRQLAARPRAARGRDEVERLDLGLEPGRAPGDASRLAGRRRRSSSPSPTSTTSGRTRPCATSRRGSSSSGSMAAPADRRAGRHGRLQRRSRRADVRSGCGLPASGRRTRRRTAPSPRSRGRRASRRRRWTRTASPSCLDYIWVRGAVAVESARLAFDRPGSARTRRSTRRTTSASRPTWRSGRRGDDAAPGPSRRLAAGAGEHARGVPRRARRAGLRRPRVRRPGGGRRRPGRDPRRDARRGSRASTRRVDELTAEALERHGVPTPRRRARGGPAPRVPRRRAEGRPGARRGRRADGRPRAGPRAGGRLVVRGRTRSSGSGGWRRCGRAGSTPMDLSDATIGLADGPGLSGDLGRLAGRSTPSRSPRPARPELDVAAWTVRSRPTYGRLERLGVNAICAEAQPSTADASPIGAARTAPARSERPMLSARSTRGRRMTDRAADLVVVGAGTVGGWASYFAKADGLGRVVVLEKGLAGQGASSRAAGIVRAQGGTPATVALGRWTIDFYNGQQAAIGTDSGFRELGYLILAVTEDDERAGRERVEMQRREGLDVRWLSAAEATALIPTPGRRRPPRRQLHRDRRLHRPAAQRPGLLARDAGGGRRAPRADGVHRAASSSRRVRRCVARRRRRDVRRTDRDRARAPDRRAVTPVGRAARRAPDPGRRRSPHGLRPRAARGVRRRADADGLRHRRGAVLAARGGRAALRLERPGRGAGRGAVDQLADVREGPRATERARAGDARARDPQDLGGDDRLHARPPADPRAGADAGRRPDRRA